MQLVEATRRFESVSNAMMNDPFYRQILAALEERLDPELFERCMCDLLRDPDIFPVVVSIPGGSDAGMDGAIADGQAEPFPLVCTTGKDVIGNLTRSLDSYLENGGRRRKVVLATSQSLTPIRRRNLEERAREKGFVLVQNVEQRGVAELLRHNSHWCRHLLSFTGTPPALSIVPQTRRPLLEIELTGREADVEWLIATEGDRLISGQPGSGKTYLLHQLVREGWGLFLVSDDLTRIANAVRDQNPKLVIVDDAHSDPGQLTRLLHLRQQIGAEFDIVATTWEGERDEVAEALGTLPTSQIRRLELLTREQILRIYKQAGLQGPDDVMRLLVDQASNKPGLAATLATLCLRGDWPEVRDGRALGRLLTTQFKYLVGPESTDLLATLGLGGDRGMPLELAGDFLGLTRQKAREQALGLAAGGVLSETSSRHLAVWPRDLRWSLVGQVFFQDSVTHDYQTLLERVPSLDSAIETILGTAHRGTEIPPSALRGLMAKSESVQVWSSFTSLGEEEARWAAQNYPGDVLDLVREALRQAPSMMIPRLFERAAESPQGPLHRTRDPLSYLEEWLKEVQLPTEAFRRRQLAARLAKGYLHAQGDRVTGIRALFLAFSPGLESTSRDPGIGRTLTTRSGLLPLKQLEAIGILWSEVHGAIRDLDAATWRYLKNALWDWIYPTHAAKQAVAEEVEEEMHAFVAKVLRDLVPLTQGSPGLTAGLNRLGSKIDLELQLEPDPVFELLYPAPTTDRDDRALLDAHEQALADLAWQWSRRSPQEVADALQEYETESALIGHNDLRKVNELCQKLAEATEHPELWVEAFIQRDLSASLLRPFLEKTVELRPREWQTYAERCLDREQYSWSATAAILRQIKTPTLLLERAIDRATHLPDLVEILCLRREVPLATLGALLKHESWVTALAAAAGEWTASSQSGIRQEILGDWRQAVLRAKTGTTAMLEYSLEDILANDPALAFEWLQLRLQDEDLPPFFSGGPFASATRALEENHKRALLDQLNACSFLRSLLPLLIGEDPVLYQRLLARQDLANHHLYPLEGKEPNDPVWIRLALQAIRSGHDPREIAGTAFYSHEGIAGHGVEYWTQREAGFANLERDADALLLEVARFGRRATHRELEKAKASQRQEELHGLG